MIICWNICAGAGIGVFRHCVLVFKLLQESEILNERMRFRFDLSCEPCVIQRSYFFIELHAASRPDDLPLQIPT